jgi:hypothetical protein
VDLGRVDAGDYGHGVVRIVNVGVKTFYLTAPGNPGIRKIRVGYPASLEVVPGGSVYVDLYADYHGDQGDVETTTMIYSNDPGASSISVPVHAFVLFSTDVRPYRDSVQAQKDGAGNLASSVVSFQFTPGHDSGPFSQIWIEDPDAPLDLRYANTDSGSIFGTVQIDVKRAMSANAGLGETRILGITANGQKNYFVLQWLLKK